MKKFFLYLFFSFSFILTYAQSGNDYERSVVEFMEVTNAKQTATVGVESMIRSMNLPISNMHAMCEEFVDAIWPNMIKEYSTIMREYYTIDDLNAIISFYKTPAGKKVVKYNPEVMRKVMETVSGPEMINIVMPIFKKYTNQ